MFHLIERGGDYNAHIQSIHPEAIPQRKVNISVCGKLVLPSNMNETEMVHYVS
jgi:hypothetical protein